MTGRVNVDMAFASSTKGESTGITAGTTAILAWATSRGQTPEAAAWAVGTRDQWRTRRWHYGRRWHHEHHDAGQHLVRGVERIARRTHLRRDGDRTSIHVSATCSYADDTDNLAKLRGQHHHHAHLPFKTATAA